MNGNPAALRRAVLVALTVALACGPTASGPTRSSAASATPLTSGGAAPIALADRLREDLRFFASQMPKAHLNLFHSTSRSTWSAAIAALDARLDRLTPAQFEVELQRLVALSKDGHTQLLAPYAGTNLVPAFHEFPLVLYAYSDGIFVQQAAPSVARLAGARLIAIGDTPIETAIQRVTPLIDRDSDAMLPWYTARYLVVPEIDEAVGIIDSIDHARFSFELDGRTETVELAVQSIGAHGGWADARGGTGTAAPLYLRDVGNAYWASRLGEEALYVQWNVVLPKPGTEESISGFFTRILQDLDAHPVAKLTIDVRFNQGGERMYVDPVVQMIRSRPAVNRPGGLFVITGRRTFSSGVVFCAQMEKLTNAVFVGEPASSRPNQYATITRFTLPNTKLVIGVSTQYNQDADPTDQRLWIAPQISIALSSRDYATDRDPAVEAILVQKP